MTYFDDMVKGYIECALWSSYDRDGEPLDAAYSIIDIEDESLDKMASDCSAFQTQAGPLLDEIDPEQCGHDFWLTRNGHGAGFWDRGLGAIGDALTTIAKSFGETYIFEGEFGKLENWQ